MQERPAAIGYLLLDVRETVLVLGKRVRFDGNDDRFFGGVDFLTESKDAVVNGFTGGLPHRQSVHYELPGDKRVRKRSFRCAARAKG